MLNYVRDIETLYLGNFWGFLKYIYTNEQNLKE